MTYRKGRLGLWLVLIVLATTRPVDVWLVATEPPQLSRRTLDFNVLVCLSNDS